MVLTGQQPALVTGASGFIGAHLCRHLRAAGHPVRGFSRSPKSWDTHPTKTWDTHPKSGKKSWDTHVSGEEKTWVSHVAGDIQNPEALKTACAGVDLVFHLAGVAQTSRRRNQQAVQTNVEGTRNLLTAARAAGAKRLIFFSSALAAELDHGQASASAGDYARSKWEAERLVLEANGEDGLLTTVLRPAPVYGPGMKGGIARMIRLIHARRLPPLPKLDRGFSLAGVDDVCRAAMLASESLLAPGQCWLLTDLQRYTANAVEQAVYDVLGRKKPGWRTPAVVFFAASAILQLGRLAGWKKAESGLQTWRNLTSERTWQAQDIFEELDFRPSGDLYEQLPEIIRDLTGQQTAPRE